MQYNLGQNGTILTTAQAQADVDGFAQLALSTQSALVAEATSLLNAATGRVLPLSYHDEYYAPEVTRRLRLRQYPLWDVLEVASGYGYVIQIQNTQLSSTIQKAAAYLTFSGAGDNSAPIGLTLWQLASGVESSSPLLFTTYPTLSQLAAAIPSAPSVSGFTASISSLANPNFACSELDSELGRKYCTGTGAFFYAFTRSLSWYDPKRETGVITLHEDAYQPQRFPDRTYTTSGKFGSMRTRYLAGYNVDANIGPITMPDRLVRAAKILIKALMQRTPAGMFESERTQQREYKFAATKESLIGLVADLIAPEVRRQFV